MSSLQIRLTEANRLVAASTSAQARLESELAFSNSELVTAHAAAAQQQAQQAPDPGQHDRMQQQRDAELRAVRAEAQAQHSRLKSELASSQAAMASLQDTADAAEREGQQQQATWQADMTEAQVRAASEKDGLQRR